MIGMGIRDASPTLEGIAESWPKASLRLAEKKLRIIRV
jgi:hypothetical protein